MFPFAPPLSHVFLGDRRNPRSVGPCLGSRSKCLFSLRIHRVLWPFSRPMRQFLEACPCPGAGDCLFYAASAWHTKFAILWCISGTNIAIFYFFLPFCLYLMASSSSLISARNNASSFLHSTSSFHDFKASASLALPWSIAVFSRERQQCAISKLGAQAREWGGQLICLLHFYSPLPHSFTFSTVSWPASTLKYPLPIKKLGINGGNCQEIRISLPIFCKSCKTGTVSVRESVRRRETPEKCRQVWGTWCKHRHARMHMRSGNAFLQFSTGLFLDFFEFPPFFQGFFDFHKLYIFWCAEKYVF